MKLSIIIPTKNEEKYLEGLLKSINTQKTSFGYEIIISDANSSDKTLEIAKKYNCVMTNGGMPSVGRNAGAKIATGDFLLFLDADSILKDGSLEKWIGKIEKSTLEIASVFLKLRSDERGIIKKLYFYSTMIGYFMGCAFGSGIIVKKELFEKIGGFKEDIYFLEDVDFIKRSKKFSKRINLYPHLEISGRRFDKIGTLKTLFYTSWWFLKFQCGYKISKNDVEKIYKL